MLGVLALDLFDKEIDCSQTMHNAERFLEHDFQVIKNYAGASATDLSSPLLDPTGVVNHSHVNNQDYKFLAVADQYAAIQACQRGVKAVLKAIEACSNGNRKPYGRLLYLRYVKYDYDTNVYSIMGYSKTQYYKFRRKALIEFAQILPSKVIEYKVNQHVRLIPDLIARK